MDINSITISNLVAPTENISATSSNTGRSKQTSDSSPISDNITGTEKTNRSYNSFRQVHEKAIEKQSGDSEQSSDKTQATTQTPETQDSTKPKIQQTNTEKTSEENSTQTSLNETPAVVTIAQAQQTNEQAMVEQAVANEIQDTTTPLLSGESNTDVKTIESTAAESPKPVNVIPETETETIPTQASQIQSEHTDSKTETPVNPPDNAIAQKTEDIIVENQTLKSETVISEQVTVSDSDQKQSSAQVDAGNQQIKTDAPVTDATQVSSPENEIKTAVDLTTKNNPETSTVDGKAPEITTNPQVIQAKSPEQQIQQSNLDTDNDKSGPSTEKQTDDKTTGIQTLSQLSDNTNRENQNVRNDTSGDSAERKLNYIDTQISDNDIKDTGNSTANGNTTNEQMLDSGTLQNSTIEQSSNIVDNTKIPESISQNQQNYTSADVGKQILESIHSSMSRQGEDQQITVRLNPPELGSVVIKFQEQDNQLTGILEVSKSQTRFEIEQALPQIVRDLADSGVQIKRLEVVLSNQQDLGQETLREQLMQNGNPQNQNANDSDSWQSGPDRGEINEFLVSNINYQYKSQLQNAFTSGGSINMLM